MNASADTAFTSTGAAATLNAACAVAGLDAAGAELIRFGQNAIYRLRQQPYVVRIARAAERARVQNEVRVARWLADSGLAATRLADVGHVAQPFEAGGRLVTIWALVEQSPDRPTMTDLGRVLRGLHDLIPPPGLGLGPFEPFRDLADRLESAPVSVRRTDVEFLRRRGGELGEAYAGLSRTFRRADPRRRAPR